MIFFIGASLSEPHINGTAVRELYMVRPSREIISSMEHKREILYCAFSCLGYGPYIRSSNLANFKFTPVQYCSIDDRVSYIPYCAVRTVLKAPRRRE